MTDSRLSEEVQKEIDKISKDYNMPVEEMAEAIAGKGIVNKLTKDSEEREEALHKLRENYDLINELLKEFLDMREDYPPLLAIWVIGTYIHKEFESYPYLFINAMRGSGKSRLLKLIAAISHNGEVLASLKEAVLFRTAKDRTFCIDEFEGLNRKEKGDLRELLNAAYKKGVSVQRMKKMKSPEGEEQVVEEFNVYCPIALANIWGMEEVLGDRCISLVLEKSAKDVITKLIENFESHPLVQKIYTNFQCSLCSVVTVGEHIKEWNNYIKGKYITTLTTYNTYTTLTTLTTQEDINRYSFFNKIDETGIQGRNLELFFPLFIIAKEIGDEVLEQILTISKTIIHERKMEEVTESRDVLVFEFVGNSKYENYESIRVLTNHFKEFLQDDDEDHKWLNSKWFGRALKRLVLVKDKKRVARGVEVILNVQKAQNKIKMFK